MSADVTEQHVASIFMVVKQTKQETAVEDVPSEQAEFQRFARRYIREDKTITTAERTLHRTVVSLIQ
jgi:hypothetical protein